VVLDVNVLRHSRSHGDIGELACFFIVFINYCGTTSLLVYILHQLPRVQNALPGAADRYVLGLRDGESNYLLLLGSRFDHSTI
jgi:hypothetical protein